MGTGLVAPEIHLVENLAWILTNQDADSENQHQDDMKPFLV